MSAAVRQKELEELKRKTLAVLPQAAKDRMKRASEKKADMFERRVTAVVPKKEGQLRSTIRREKGSTETAAAVAIGTAETPYPLHLEAGHRAPDGTIVPGRPYWNKTKKAVQQNARLLDNETIREVCAIVGKGPA